MYTLGSNENVQLSRLRISIFAHICTRKRMYFLQIFMRRVKFAKEMRPLFFRGFEFWRPATSTDGSLRRNNEGTASPNGVRPTVRHPVIQTCKTRIVLHATIFSLFKANKNVAACGRHHKRGGAAGGFLCCDFE